MTCQHCPQEPPRTANILWTYDGDPVPVCWYHFHLLMLRVLGIGRETAVRVNDGNN